MLEAGTVKNLVIFQHYIIVQKLL